MVDSATGRRTRHLRLDAGHLLMAAIILLLLSTGGAYAAGKLTGADIKNGTITTADVKDENLTGNDVQDGSLTNEDVGVLFAQVDAGATVSNSSGGVTATSLGIGTYQVTFAQAVNDCAFVATQGEGGIGGAGGAILGVTDRSGNSNAVFVTVRNNSNTLTNAAFQLVVVC